MSRNIVLGLLLHDECVCTFKNCPPDNMDPNKTDRPRLCPGCGVKYRPAVRFDLGKWLCREGVRDYPREISACVSLPMGSKCLSPLGADPSQCERLDEAAKDREDRMAEAKEKQERDLDAEIKRGLMLGGADPNDPFAEPSEIAVALSR